MINYFSIGCDAKIGVDFELERTGSRFCNRGVYGLMCLKSFFKMCCCCCCCPEPHVMDLIDYVKIIPQ